MPEFCLAIVRHSENKASIMAVVNHSLCCLFQVESVDAGSGVEVRFMRKATTTSGLLSMIPHLCSSTNFWEFRQFHTLMAVTDIFLKIIRKTPLGLTVPFKLV